MKAIELVPATKNEKAIALALNMLKNMLNYGYLKDVNISSILKFLNVFRNISCLS